MDVRGAPHTSWLLLIALLALAIPSPSAAQGAIFLPLDDIGYEYIDALIARGALRQLSALERPYTIASIEAALDSVGRGRESNPGAIESWKVALRSILAKRDFRGAPGAGSVADLDGVEVMGSIGAQVTASTSGLRELMRADDISGIYPGVTMRFAVRGGPIVAVTRVISDHRYKDDPEYTGKVDRIVAGRVEDAYVAAQWRYGSLSFGRLARNWGPVRLDGLQVGHYAYTYDHLQGRLGTDRLHLTSVLTRLDDLPDSSGAPAARYLALHRLAFRWRSLEVGLTEAMLYGGAGRQLELSYANPLNVFQLSQYNERTVGNVSFGVDAALRTRSYGSWSAQLLIDDFQVDDCDPSCEEPSSYGATVAAEGLPLYGAQRWFASYTRVSNLAYRTPKPYERYASQGVGLGRGFADYDELRAGLDLAVIARTTLRLYGAYSRQGEGDYRTPFPDPSDYGATTGFLSGTVQRVVRLALSGSALAGPLEIQGDVGYNARRNAGFAAGARARSFEGWIKFSLDPIIAIGLAP